MIFSMNKTTFLTYTVIGKWFKCIMQEKRRGRVFTLVNVAVKKSLFKKIPINYPPALSAILMNTNDPERLVYIYGRSL